MWGNRNATRHGEKCGRNTPTVQSIDALGAEDQAPFAVATLQRCHARTQGHIAPRGAPESDRLVNFPIPSSLHCLASKAKQMEKYAKHASLASRHFQPPRPCQSGSEGHHCQAGSLSSPSRGPLAKMKWILPLGPTSTHCETWLGRQLGGRHAGR